MLCHQIYYLFFYAEVLCPTIESWNGLVINTTERTVITHVNVTCQDGMVMNDTAKYHVYVCMGTGQWNKGIVPCIG